MKRFSHFLLCLMMLGVLDATAQDFSNQYFSKHSVLENYAGFPRHLDSFYVSFGDASFSPDGSILAVPGIHGVDGTNLIALQMWNVATGEPVVIDGPLVPDNSYFFTHGGSDFSPDGRTLAVATNDPSSDNGLILWDVVTKQHKTIAMERSVDVDFSPDGRTLAVALSFDNVILLLDVVTGQREIIEDLMWSNSKPLSFSPDGSVLAVANLSGADLWDVSTKQLQKKLELPGAKFINTVIFSPDGSTLIVGANIGAAVWDVRTGQRRTTMKWAFPQGGCDSVALSPDGTVLAGGGFTGTRLEQGSSTKNGNGIVLWNVATGQSIITMNREVGGTRWVRFSPDGTILATRGRDMNLWELRNPLAPSRPVPVTRTPKTISPRESVEVVSIPDPNLAATVRKALGLGANAPITNQALQRLTKLDAILNQIKDLTGLEHATQLTELSLFSNQIRNISPLTGLTRLKRLNVERNQISNITPLAGLTQLETLYLGVNQVNNQGVQRLSNLTQLRWLSLYGNQISNIKPLANLTKLEQLHLADNQIRDVSPLAGLKNLEVLFLQGNPIQDTSPLAALTKLRRTDIDISDPQPNSGNVAPEPEGTEPDGPAPPAELPPAPEPAVPVPPVEPLPPPIEDVVSIPDANLAAAVRKALGLGTNAPITKQAIQRLTRLEARESQIKNLTGLEHATQLTELRLYKNQIRNISPLAGLTRLKRLDVDINQISNINPLAGLTQLEGLYLGANQINNQGVQLLANLTRLKWLSLYGNQISNIKPLASLTKLEGLWIERNQISDVSPLARLVNLKTLDIRTNSIRDIRSLAGLTKLTDLKLKGNPIQDKSPLSTLKARNPKLELDIEIPPLSPVVHLEAAQRPPLYWVDATTGTLHRLVGDEVENLVPNVKNATGLAVDMAGGRLYWTEKTSDRTGTILRANLDGSDSQLVKDLTSVPINIAVDAVNGKLYLANSWGKIQRFNLDGSNFESNLVTGLNNLDEIAVDAAGGKIYWTEQTGENTGRVRRADLDGSNVELVKELNNVPQGIAVDPSNGKLYLTNSRGKVQRFNLDGSNFEWNFIVNLSSPQGIAVDVAGRKIYWTEKTGIRRANLDGTNIQGVVTGLRSPTGIAMVPVPDDTSAVPTTGTWLFVNKPSNLTLDNFTIRPGEFAVLVHQGEQNAIKEANFKTYASYFTLDGNADLPNLAHFFQNGGRIELVSHASLNPLPPNTKKPEFGDIVISEIMWGLNRSFPAKQYIELYNASAHTYTFSNGDVSFRFSEASKSPLPDRVFPLPPNPNAHAKVVDRVSNKGWKVPGSSGDISEGKPLISMYRTIDYTTGDTPDGTLVSSWKASTGRVNLPAPSYGTPGAKHISDGAARAEDVNQDKKVNKTDLLLVVTALGEKPPANPNFDVNADGTVNIADVLLVIEALDDPVTAAAPALGETITSLDPGRLTTYLNILRAESDGSMQYEQAIAFFQSLLGSIRPTETRLLANYPNPFNPETWIPYQLASASTVKITIYEAKGTLVRTLVLGHQPIGYYTSRNRAAYWDGRNTLGERVASGIYFYQLQADDLSLLRKMVILK